jgi:hypothetical protein
MGLTASFGDSGFMVALHSVIKLFQDRLAWMGINQIRTKSNHAKHHLPYFC